MRASSIPESLAAEVAGGARRGDGGRTLLLDLDGTLAPKTAAPEGATVPDTTRRALRALRRAGWSIVIVTGRRAADAKRIVAMGGARIVGSHGAEGLTGARGPRPSRAALSRFRVVARRVRSEAARHPGVGVELKKHGLALHDRSLPTARRRRWRRRLTRSLEGCDLEGLRIVRRRGTIEIRPAAIHKGLAVAALANGGPRSYDPTIVAVGDDGTDEDLFRVLRGRGLTVRVGPRRVRSAAVRRLPSPVAVGRFLARLAALEAAR